MRLPRNVLMPDNGNFRFGYATPAAAGSSQATGTALTAQISYVTAADGTKGVVLPSALKGMMVTVINGAAATLKVYPFTGDSAAINAIAADGAFSVGADRVAYFVAASKTQWYVAGSSAAATVLVVGSSGVTPISAPSGIANWQPIAATSGTDTAFANNTQFLSSLFIPVNKTITNINYLIGSVGGTDKVYGVLYDSTGAVLANTSLTTGGATVGTAANIQTLALTATYAAKGPGLFYVGISANGNTAKLRTVPAFTQAGIWAGSVTQTHGTVAAVVGPTTFTADKAPVCFVD